MHDNEDGVSKTWKQNWVLFSDAPTGMMEIVCHTDTIFQTIPVRECSKTSTNSSIEDMRGKKEDNGKRNEYDEGEEKS